MHSSREDLDRLTVGRRLAGSLAPFWTAGGYLHEGGRWLASALRGAEGDRAEVARCYVGLGAVASFHGDDEVGLEHGTKGVAMWRRLGDDVELANGLVLLAQIHMAAQDTTTARAVLHEAIEVAERAGQDSVLAYALTSLADNESYDGNLESALEIYDRAIAVHDRLRHRHARMTAVHNKACTLRELGRASEAEALMREQMLDVIALHWFIQMISVAEDYAAVLAELDEPVLAARLLGAADATRTRNEWPRSAAQQAEIAEPLSKGAASLGAERWQIAYDEGTRMVLEDALRAVAAARG